MHKHGTEVLWVQSQKRNVPANNWRVWLIASIVSAALITPVTLQAQRGNSNRGDRPSREGRDSRADSPPGARARNSGGNRTSTMNRNPAENRDWSLNRNSSGNHGGRDRDAGLSRNPNLNREANGSRYPNISREPSGNRDTAISRNPGGNRASIFNREGQERGSSPFGRERDRNPGVNRIPSENRAANRNRDLSLNRDTNAQRDAIGNRNPSVNRGERNRDFNWDRNANANRDAIWRRNSGGNRDAGTNRNQGGRDIQRNRNHDAARGFTRSVDGRRFDNGVTLRRGTYFTDRRWDSYFPHRYFYYPYYAPTRSVSVQVVVSPFHYYYGVTPTYIPRTHVLHMPPRRVYIEVPIYIDNEYRGYRDSDDDYYLARRNDNSWTNDPELTQTVNDLTDAFREEDIALLTELTDPDTKIAIFSSGQYQYSLEPGDYLDMTRDFMYAAETATFTVERVLSKTSGVSQIFAKHTYRNREGNNRTVYLCFVVENLSGRWAITQVDTSPDRIEN